MSLSLDTTVWNALESVAARDPDYAEMSAPVIQALYGTATLRSLVERLKTRMLLTCANIHDDPCSDVSLATCPLRELNIACGHQDRFGSDIRGPSGVRTPGSAMVALCDAMIADGAKEAAMLRDRATELIHDLSVQDGAAFIGYRRLRGRHEDLEYSAVPRQAFRSPLASPSSLEAHREAITKEQNRLGQQMLDLRDEIFRLLETRAQEKIILESRVQDTSLVQLTEFVAAS